MPDLDLDTLHLDKCVSPVLAAFGRGLDDCLPDDLRQELRGFIPLLVGTAGDGRDKARGWLALNWLVRTCAPAWLDLAGLGAEATQLRGLPRIVDLATAEAAGPVAQASADKAHAAWDAARAAARAAVGAAAWDAARAAAWDASRAAAWVAVGDAAWVAVGDAAWVAVGDAAWGAIWAAAWVAVGDTAGGTRAVGDAVRAVLAPTVETLQRSAITLYGRMITAGRDA
jgi:hypothetical protein